MDGNYEDLCVVEVVMGKTQWDKTLVFQKEHLFFKEESAKSERLAGDVNKTV